ncbi:MAG: N-acetylmuramoyl-L-alanine amidase-like domain-containing protein [Pseudolabrys sp.]
MPFDSSLSRRHILQMLAGGAALAAGVRPVQSSEARIAALIDSAKTLPTVAQRIDFIAGALRGARYRGYTLIGGPHRPEKFVARDDGFDCVTFCETVLAAAKSSNLDEFEQILRVIRYHNGVVAWRERNHYFFEWGQHNVENKTCRWVKLDGSVDLQKTVSAERGLGRRRFPMTVIPRDVMLASKGELAAGDIVGFVTARKNLDYFHVGFIAFGKDGELLLRHASQSKHRVLDERMDRFAALNRVHYVTLLRPEEKTA